MVHSSVVVSEDYVGELDTSENIVRQAIAKYFPYGGILGLVLSKRAEMENLFIKMSVTVVLFTTNNSTVDCRSQSLDLQGYILVTSCESSLESQTLPALSCFNQSSFRLRSKRILILDVCLRRDSYDFNRYLRCLEFLWKTHGLVYVSILPIWKSSSKKIILKSVFAYNPFETGNSFNSGLVQTDVDGNFVYSFRKRFRNMNGYKLKALDSFFKLSTRVRGVEGPTISDEIQSFFNLTIEVIRGGRYKYEGDKKGNESVYHYITNHLGDVSLYKFFYLDYNSSMIDYLNFKHTDNFVCVVIKQAIKPWEIILYAFTKELWFWIGLSYLLICFCAIIFSRYETSKDRSSVWFRMSSDLSRVCHALFTKSISKLPTRTSERLLLGLSLWVGFMVTTVLLGQIIRFMYSSPQPPVIDTVEELKKIGLTFDTSTIRDFLEKHEKELQANFIKRTHHKSTCSGVRKKALTMFESEASGSDLFSEKGVYVVRERIFVWPVSYIVRADSFLTEHLNRFHSRLHDSGVTSYMDTRRLRAVQSMYRHGELVSLYKCYTGTKTGSAKVLSYGDLKLAFYSLYIGFTLSVVCLIIEKILMLRI